MRSARLLHKICIEKPSGWRVLDPPVKSGSPRGARDAFAPLASWNSGDEHVEVVCCNDRFAAETILLGAYAGGSTANLCCEPVKWEFENLHMRNGDGFFDLVHHLPDESILMMMSP